IPARRAQLPAVGFRELRINQEALAARTLAIHRAEGIFPDGLPFDIPGSDPAPVAKALPEYVPGDFPDPQLELIILLPQ
ncbi:MAG: type VI secretion system baseplate subunit TssK, partial [Bryobacteraceae bacterium]